VMKSLDIVCLTTDCETFGKVLVEAQAMGTPVIATRAGGAPEALCEGETGLLFEPNNSSELASQLKRLAQDPHLRDQMGNRAIKYVRKRFDWDQHFNRIQKIYRDLS